MEAEVEHAARAICRLRGLDPDELVLAGWAYDGAMAPSEAGASPAQEPRWFAFRETARDVIAVLISLRLADE